MECKTCLTYNTSYRLAWTIAWTVHEIAQMTEPTLDRQFARDLAVVILCGGRGTRMGSAEKHKVCFPIEGVPAINRTVGMFDGLGAGKIVIVVGAMAGQVVSTVGAEFPHVLFAYQDKQSGTGHAAQIGVQALQRLGHTGTILITMGDKVIAPAVIVELARQFVTSRCDLIFVTGPKTLAGDTTSTAGRIVTDTRGNVLCNVELRDIRRLQILEQIHKTLAKGGKGAGDGLSAERIMQIGRRYIGDTEKLLKALTPVDQFLRAGKAVPAEQLRRLLGPRGGAITIAGKPFTAEMIEKRAKTVNLSVYLGREQLFYELLPRIQPDNAQNEYYLTDIIKLAADDAQGWKLQQFVVDKPTDVMAFNSPDQLLQIEDAFRRKKVGVKVTEPLLKVRLGARQYKPASQWLKIFETFPPKLRSTLAGIYGTDESLLNKRRKLFLKAIKLFARRFGADRKAVVVRAPGRLNLMGRHVDHRGGAVNVMAIDRDVIFVADARQDDVVNLVNVDRRRFPDRRFSISEVLGAMQWDDWLTYVNSRHVRQILMRSAGDWSNYVKASLVRLQQSYHQLRIFGMDAAVVGDVPMAAGLSSSSALVVASAEVAVALNGLDVTPSELVDFCGEGEWFVGSRGGAADHAAIHMGRRGSIAHVRFFPFKVHGIYCLPTACKVLIANSGQSAQKSATAKDRFNQRVATYELGFMLLKDRLPQYDHLLEHVRDVNPQRLNCTVSDIYRMLLNVPERISREELTQLLSARHKDRVERVLASHQPPKEYDLRGVLLYGVAECQRSLMCPNVLQSGDLRAFGTLMNVSHDGDRVCRYRLNSKSKRWRRTAYHYDFSQQAINNLCDDLASEDPQRVLRAQLYMQPGSYACSTERIDKMVDIALNTGGVYGAQLAGAGLGGCIMVLAAPQAMPTLQKALTTQYYHPLQLPPNMHVCNPVEGSGAISV